jgi:hypothetical protein
MKAAGFGMVGSDLDTAAHSAPWWVGVGVLLLGLCAAWEWRTAMQADALLRPTTALPAALAIMGLVLVSAGLTFASNDGEPPPCPVRQATPLAATGVASPDPLSLAGRPARALHRVAPLPNQRVRSRRLTKDGHGHGSTSDRRAAGQKAKSASKHSAAVRLPWVRAHLHAGCRHATGASDAQGCAARLCSAVVAAAVRHLGLDERIVSNWVKKFRIWLLQLDPSAANWPRWPRGQTSAPAPHRVATGAAWVQH